jgi:GTP 3',8-cyclase
VLARLSEDGHTFAPAEAQYRGEVAARYRDEVGHEAGLITSVTSPFCGDCTRARISAVGLLYTCLFASQGHDFRELLRSGLDAAALDTALDARLAGIWQARHDRYSEERGEVTASTRAKVEMSHIGG